MTKKRAMRKISIHQQRKENDLKADFNRLSSITEHGVKKYSNEYIIAWLAHKYYYSTITVEKIMNGQYDRYRRRQSKSNPKEAAGTSIA